jgi:hypothetical protein
MQTLMTELQPIAPWGWVAIQHEGHTHVLPRSDTGNHQWENCPCCPQVDEEHFIVSHNSFDGREAFASGERKVS